MDQTPRQPSTAQSISAVSNVQLRRYSTDTIALVDKSLKRWAGQISSPQHLVEPYFILLSFNDIEDPNQREFLNQIPTSFSLTDEQVDALIAAGGELLRNNVEFRRLMADLAADARAGH
jgi:NTE family protein